MLDGTPQVAAAPLTAPADEALPPPLFELLLKSLPAVSRVLEIGGAGDALSRAYLQGHARCVWHHDVGKRQPAYDVIVLHEGATREGDPLARLGVLGKHAHDGTQLYFVASNLARWQTLQGLIEGDVELAATRRHHSLPAIYKHLMDDGWMPTLAAHLPCAPANARVANAAEQLAAALCVPPATARRNLALDRMLIQAQRAFGDPAAFRGRDTRARFAVVVPTTRDGQLQLNVERSPGLAEVGARVVAVRGASSPADALARALEHCDAEWVLLCHQDVYFPRSFGHRLNAVLADVPPERRASTLLGFIGMAVNAEQSGFEPAGFVIDRSTRADHAANDKALSLDESAIVIARDSIHRIDPHIGWHLWATDLCLAAICEHKVFARIVRLPLYHNSLNDYRLPASFDESAARLLAKYPDFRPIPTLCGTIDAKSVAQQGGAPLPASTPASTTRRGKTAPSITTLIPAYKIDYLAELFLGLRTQNYKHFRVVLSDDSPGAAITGAIRAGAFDALIAPLDLHVVRGPTLGSFKNIQFLLDSWGQDAPLVHVHLDDDVIYPDFYRAHALAHSSGHIGASVSLRWLTTSDARPNSSLQLPAFLDAHAERVLSLGPEQLFAHTVPQCENWLGELSNTVLSAEAAARYRHGTMQGLSYYGLGDIGVLLDVSRHAPIAFIRDHLSGFRSNPQQSSAQGQSFAVRCGFIAWAALALAAWREHRITPRQAEQSLAITAQRCREQHAADPQVAAFITLAQRHAADLQRLYEEFGLFWSDMLAGDADSRASTARTAPAALAC